MQDDPIDRSLGYALVRAFRLANRTATRMLQRHELSAEQAHILFVLWTRGPMRIGELQSTLALSSGTMTGALDRMTAAGLVRRAPDPEDGRVYRIEPAPIDVRRRKAIETTLETIQRDTFAKLTAKERDELLRLLRKMSAE